MKLTVNGAEREIAASATVRQLIVELGLTGKAVAVEVNKELVPKRAHENAVLQPGDQVEIVSLVGGG